MRNSFDTFNRLSNMIQRIQTVYLFLGGIALASLGAFEMPWNSAAASMYSWFVPSLVGLLIGTVAGAIWAIFLYEQRKRQRSVVVGVQIGTVLVAGLLYGSLYVTSELAFRSAQGIIWSRAVVLGMPIVAYVLFFLARRGIDHDIELVKSMDRIR